MGATTFMSYYGVMSRATRGQADEVFEYARKHAQYENGHGGYTGTIAEKNSFCVISDEGISYAKAFKLADDLIEQSDARIDDKWGPAGAIRVKQRASKNQKPMDGWLFFGWASE
jgi:hypothetical protein